MRHQKANNNLIKRTQKATPLIKPLPRLSAAATTGFYPDARYFPDKEKKMCNEYNHDTMALIVPPNIAIKILENPGDIFLRHCPCRLEKGNCKQKDTEICLLFENASEDALKNAKQVSKSQALSILEKARNRGDITHIFYKKDDKKFTEICSCCDCCCSMLRKMEIDGFENFKSSGYIADTDHKKCTLCSECVDSCFFGARSIVGEKLILNEKLCFGCERCREHCDVNAITLSNDRGIKIPADL